MTTFQIQFGVELSIKLKASHVGKNWQIPDPIFINTIKLKVTKVLKFLTLINWFWLIRCEFYSFVVLIEIRMRHIPQKFLYGNDTWVICQSIDWHLLKNFSISTDFGSFYNAQSIIVVQTISFGHRPNH